MTDTPTKFPYAYAPGENIVAGTVHHTGPICDMSGSFVTPASGDSVQLLSDSSRLFVSGSATLAALTLLMPTDPDQGQVATIKALVAVTELTIESSASQTPAQLFSGAAAAGMVLEFVFYEGEWF